MAEPQLEELQVIGVVPPEPLPPAVDEPDMPPPQAVSSAKHPKVATAPMVRARRNVTNMVITPR